MVFKSDWNFCIKTAWRHNFTELFAFCKENNVGMSVRYHKKEFDTEYYLRLRRGDKAVDQVFDGSTLELLKDPEEMIQSSVEELINDLRRMDDDALHESFYRDLAFGTGGLRGILGAGTNRMNLFTVMKATAGLAAFLLEWQGNSVLQSRDELPRRMRIR